MRTIVQHIFIYFTVALIVAATGGISLIQHFCHCGVCEHPQVVTETLELAEPSEDACCAQPVAEDLHSCCDTPSDRHHSAESCHTSHHCCVTNYTFLKTDPMNLSDTGKKSYKFEIAYEQVIITEGISLEYNSETTPYSSDRSPPPDFGVTLLISIHQLKTDPLLS